MPVLSNSELEYYIWLIFNFKKEMKFEIHVHEGHSEGSVSQILYLGPSFYFMKSRKKCFKK